uniref:Uncharacterized protein n=1 Tax=Percolomonas cosmopolitus TaxID=63605 RepID=A0A7S1PI36_9EUKA
MPNTNTSSSSSSSHSPLLPINHSSLIFIPNSDNIIPENTASSSSQQYYRLVLSCQNGGGAASAGPLRLTQNISFMHVFHNGMVLYRGLPSCHRQQKNTTSSHSSTNGTGSRRNSVASMPHRVEYVFGLFGKERQNDAHTLSESFSSPAPESDVIEIWFLDERMENVAYCRLDDFRISTEDISSAQRKKYPLIFFGGDAQMPMGIENTPSTPNGLSGSELLHSATLDSPSCYITWERMSISSIIAHFRQHRQTQTQTKSPQQPLYRTPSPHYLPFIQSPRGSHFHLKFDFSSLIQHWMIFFGANVYIALYSKRRHQILGQINHFGRIMEFTNHVPHKLPTQDSSVDYELLDEEESLRMNFLTSLDVEGIDELERRDDSLCLILIFTQQAPLSSPASSAAGSVLSPHSEHDDSPSVIGDLSNFTPIPRTDLRIDTTITPTRNGSSHPLTAADSFTSPKRTPASLDSVAHSASTPTNISNDANIQHKPPYHDTHSNSFVPPKVLSRQSSQPFFLTSPRRTPRTPTSVSTPTPTSRQNSFSYTFNGVHTDASVALGEPVAFAILPLWKGAECREFISNDRHTLRVYKGSPELAPWSKQNPPRTNTPLSNLKMGPINTIRINQKLKSQNLVCEVVMQAHIQHNEIVQDSNISKSICEVHDKDSMDDILVNIVQSEGQIVYQVNDEFELWRHTRRVLKSLGALYELSLQYAKMYDYDAEGRVALMLFTHLFSFAQRIMHSQFAEFRNHFKDCVKQCLSPEFFSEFFTRIHDRIKREHTLQIRELQKRTSGATQDDQVRLIHREYLSHLSVLAYIASIFSEKVDTSYVWFFDTVKLLLQDSNTFLAEILELHAEECIPVRELLSLVHRLFPACCSLSLREPFMEKGIAQLFSNLCQISGLSKHNLDREECEEFLWLIGNLYSVQPGHIEQYSLYQLHHGSGEHIAEQLKLQKIILGDCASIISHFSLSAQLNVSTSQAFLHALLSIFDTFICRDIPRHVEDALKEKSPLIYLDFADKTFPLFKRLHSMLQIDDGEVFGYNHYCLVLCFQRFMVLLTQHEDIFRKILKRFMPEVQQTEQFFTQFFSIQRNMLMDLNGVQSSASSSMLLVQSCETVAIVIEFVVTRVYHGFDWVSEAWKELFLCLVCALRLCGVNDTLRDAPTEAGHPPVELTLWRLLVEILISDDCGPTPLLCNMEICDSFVDLFWHHVSSAAGCDSYLLQSMWCLASCDCHLQSYPLTVLHSIANAVQKMSKGVVLAESFDQSELSQLTNRISACFSQSERHAHKIQKLFPHHKLPQWIVTKEDNAASKDHSLAAFADECILFADSSLWFNTFWRRVQQEREYPLLEFDTSTHRFTDDHHWFEFSKELTSDLTGMEFHLCAALDSLLGTHLKLKNLRDAHKYLLHLMHIHYNLENWKQLANCCVLCLLLVGDGLQYESLFELADMDVESSPHHVITLILEVISAGEDDFIGFMTNRVFENQPLLQLECVELLKEASRFFALAGNSSLAQTILNRIRGFFEKCFHEGLHTGDNFSNLMSIHNVIISFYKHLREGGSYFGVSQRFVVVAIRHLEFEAQRSVLPISSLWHNGDYLFQLRSGEDFENFASRIKSHFPHSTILMPRDVLPLSPKMTMLKLTPALNPHKLALLQSEKNVSAIQDVDLSSVRVFEPVHDEEPYSGDKCKTFSEKCHSLTLFPKHSTYSISRFVRIVDSRTEIQIVEKANVIATWLKNLLYILKWLPQGGAETISADQECAMSDETRQRVCNELMSLLLDHTQSHLDGYIMGFSSIQSVEQQYDSMYNDKCRKAKTRARQAYVSQLKAWRKAADPTLPEPQKPSYDNLVAHDQLMLEIRELRGRALESVSGAYEWVMQVTSEDGDKDSEIMNTLKGDEQDEHDASQVSHQSQEQRRILMGAERLWRLERSMSQVLLL